MHYRPLTHLQTLHARIERELHAERKRPMPDATRITRLKKFKLAIKDRIAMRERPSRGGPAYA